MMQFYENQPLIWFKGLDTISASLHINRFLHISSEVTIACISPSQVTSHETYILLQNNDFLLESDSGSILVQVRPLRPSFILPSNLTFYETRSPGPFFAKIYPALVFGIKLKSPFPCNVNLNPSLKFSHCIRPITLSHLPLIFVKVPVFAKKWHFSLGNSSYEMSALLLGRIRKCHLFVTC